MAAKSLKARWGKKPKLLRLGHMSFLICDVNIWDILSAPQVQNTARITVIQFPILNTEDEKYTADSPRIRPYSNKILSDFAKWFTFHSQMTCRYYKNISSRNRFLINIWTTLRYLNSCYSLVWIYFHRVVMAGSDAFFFSPSVNTNNCNIYSQLDLTLLKVVYRIILFLFFWLHKQPTNMCKLNVLVHLKYKWLNVL